MIETSEYNITKGGYMQSQDGQNISCFSNLSVDEAKKQCDALGDKCAGFSIAIDNSGGCFKSNIKGGLVNDSNYNGYTKSKILNESAVTTNQNDRDLKASVCKSTPNGLNNLAEEIDICSSTVEIKRNNNFAGNTIKLEQDISSLSSTTMDTLIMGDTMFGQSGHNDIANQINGRNEELKNKKNKLLKEIEKSEAIIERSNRDFSDVKDTIKEPEPKRFLRFIEDYTLAILCMSYLFMIIAVIYIYTITAEFKLIGFGKSFILSILLTMFLFMILFYLS